MEVLQRVDLEVVDMRQMLNQVKDEDFDKGGSEGLEKVRQVEKVLAAIDSGLDQIRAKIKREEEEMHLTETSMERERRRAESLFHAHDTKDSV